MQDKNDVKIQFNEKNYNFMLKSVLNNSTFRPCQKSEFGDKCLNLLSKDNFPSTITLLGIFGFSLIGVGSYLSRRTFLRLNRFRFDQPYKRTFKGESQVLSEDMLLVFNSFVNASMLCFGIFALSSSLVFRAMNVNSVKEFTKKVEFKFKGEVSDRFDEILFNPIEE
jgi:hypothetical protein